MSDLERRVSDLEARLALMEASMNLVLPWLTTMYGDMLALHSASGKQMRGDVEDAALLVNEVKKHYAQLAGAGALKTDE